MGSGNVVPSTSELLAELAAQFVGGEPGDDEFTIEMFHETLAAQGVDRSRETVRTWLNTQAKRGRLSRRTCQGKTFYRKV